MTCATCENEVKKPVLKIELESLTDSNDFMELKWKIESELCPAQVGGIAESLRSIVDKLEHQYLLAMLMGKVRFTKH